MYGNGYPYIPPASPPPPRRTGLPPLAISAIAVGVVGVLGVGSCVLVGGFYALRGAGAAEADAPREPVAANEPSDRDDRRGSGAANPPASKTWNLADEDDTNENTAASKNTNTNGAAANQPSTAGKGGSTPPSATGTSTSPSGGASPRWFCNATGWVRVCGFANVCSNQTVFGSGFGSDRMVASTTAKNACEGMARAKGGYGGSCSVSCSLR
ncbi:hypothetical protein AKJ09_09290 [Labilithrix luteola]|uniref:DUF4189 domain-containing protein n=1 Tax=Labilithrix luteola TaxID=1391654 RepID=A0A0K1QAC3_9BACT|nr:hypothetical protein AKJ09_09290 [Labilithrix luteola]